jgi:hypothetical protein
MSYTVKRIDKKTANSVVSTKHYSRRLGIFWEGFGLYDNDKLVGVCCFGQPSPAIQKHAFKDRTFRLYELTRLVVDDGLYNAASFLIATSLKMLSQRPCAVVSYADSMHGHCGIVYQATNWLYTGSTVSHDKLYKIGESIYHPITLRDQFGVTNPIAWCKGEGATMGVEIIHPEPKHRYFFFCGTSNQKKQMQSLLRYEHKPYPKSEKKTYDSGSKKCAECIG